MCVGGLIKGRADWGWGCRLMEWWGLIRGEADHREGLWAVGQLDSPMNGVGRGQSGWGGSGRDCRKLVGQPHPLCGGRAIRGGAN